MLLGERIQELEDQIATIQESKHNETKSSAGDKYETGRAMMQMEEDKVNAQLEQTQQMLLQLERIDPIRETSTIGLGSIVTTTARTYFLGIALGKISLQGTDYFCLSPSSPIGRELWNNQLGADITFNGKIERITRIE